ncbi:hypothetical protein HDK90DRAFT_298564 [Phyllosticta capitalensis]|uniref:Uncharacterized protein n=1 Tax=Phyllosticta capitalensis TaxID=121624 RepID=A0ABR1YJZ2_9PEZI
MQGPLLLSQPVRTQRSGSVDISPITTSTPTHFNAKYPSRSTLNSRSTGTREMRRRSQSVHQSASKSGSRPRCRCRAAMQMPCTAITDIHPHCPPLIDLFLALSASFWPLRSLRLLSCLIHLTACRSCLHFRVHSRQTFRPHRIVMTIDYLALVLCKSDQGRARQGAVCTALHCTALSLRLLRDAKRPPNHRVNHHIPIHPTKCASRWKRCRLLANAVPFCMDAWQTFRLSSIYLFLTDKDPVYL